MKKSRKAPTKKPPKLHPEIVELLNDINAYCDRRGLTRTSFGLAIANDGHFIKRLEQGRLSTLRTIDRVRSFIRARNGKHARADARL